MMRVDISVTVTIVTALSVVDAQLIRFTRGRHYCQPSRRYRMPKILRNILRPHDEYDVDVKHVRLPSPAPETIWHNIFVPNEKEQFSDRKTSSNNLFIPKEKEQSSDRETSSNNLFIPKEKEQSSESSNEESEIKQWNENPLQRIENPKENNKPSQQEKTPDLKTVLVPKEKKYYLGVHKMTWFEAKHQCDATEQKLATVMNQKESDLLTDIIKRSDFQGHRFWLGGNDLKHEGVFVWGVDKGLTYTNWNLQQPDNDGGAENCMEILPYRGYKWNDYNCASKQFYICEYY